MSFPSTSGVWHTVPVPVKKLSSAPAFIVRDLDGEPATGQVRMARKILHSSATDMARSITYSFAAFGIKRGGASGGINAEGDDRESALSAFIEEVNPLVSAGELHLDPAKGIKPGGLDTLQSASGRVAACFDPAVQAAGVVAATSWALGGSLEGKSVALEGASLGPIPAAVTTAVVKAGATIVEVAGVDKKPWMIWGADVDAVLCGSKLGVLNHQGAEFVKAKAIVPWGPTPVTTKAFAMLKRQEVTVLPDFVSAAGGLLAGYLGGDSPTLEHGTDVATLSNAVSLRITDVLTRAAFHEDGVLLGACHLAEEFLATWVDEPPFGRPLAS